MTDPIFNTFAIQRILPISLLPSRATVRRAAVTIVHRRRVIGMPVYRVARLCAVGSRFFRTRRSLSRLDTVRQITWLTRGRNERADTIGAPVKIPISPAVTSCDMPRCLFTLSPILCCRSNIARVRGCGFSPLSPPPFPRRACCAARILDSRSLWEVSRSCDRGPSTISLVLVVDRRSCELNRDATDTYGNYTRSQVSSFIERGYIRRSDVPRDSIIRR